MNNKDANNPSAFNTVAARSAAIMPIRCVSDQNEITNCLVQPCLYCRWLRIPKIKLCIQMEAACNKLLLSIFLNVQNGDLFSQILVLLIQMTYSSGHGKFEQSGLMNILVIEQQETFLQSGATICWVSSCCRTFLMYTQFQNTD